MAVLLRLVVVATIVLSILSFFEEKVDKVKEQLKKTEKMQFFGNEIPDLATFLKNEKKEKQKALNNILWNHSYIQAENTLQQDMFCSFYQDYYICKKKDEEFQKENKEKN